MYGEKNRAACLEDQPIENLPARRIANNFPELDVKMIVRALRELKFLQDCAVNVFVWFGLCI